MRDRPTAVGLLAAVRRTLLDDLLPALPPGRRDDARMAAAAVATVERELEAGTAALTAERAALEALYGETAGPQESLDAALGRLNARFAADLRAGVFDHAGPRREAALRLLRRATLAKLSENSPDYPLQAGAAGAGGRKRPAPAGQGPRRPPGTPVSRP